MPPAPGVRGRPLCGSGSGLAAQGSPPRDRAPPTLARVTSSSSTDTRPLLAADSTRRMQTPPPARPQRARRALDGPPVGTPEVGMVVQPLPPGRSWSGAAGSSPATMAEPSRERLAQILFRGSGPCPGSTRCRGPVVRRPPTLESRRAAARRRLDGSAVSTSPPATAARHHRGAPRRAPDHRSHQRAAAADRPRPLRPDRFGRAPLRLTRRAGQTAAGHRASSREEPPRRRDQHAPGATLRSAPRSSCVQLVAQGVAEHVQAEHEGGDRPAREDGHVRRRTHITPLSASIKPQLASAAACPGPG